MYTETKVVTPLEACSDSGLYLEEVNGEPKLKRNHHYYAQVQGQMGVTGAKWLDFIVYTSKGMSIERIPLILILPYETCSAVQRHKIASK